MKKSQQGEKEEEELGDREERNGVKTEFLKMLIFLKYKINLRSSNLQINKLLLRVEVILGLRRMLESNSLPLLWKERESAVFHQSFFFWKFLISYMIPLQTDTKWVKWKFSKLLQIHNPVIYYLKDMHLKICFNLTQKKTKQCYSVSHSPDQ